MGTKYPDVEAFFVAHMLTINVLYAFKCTFTMHYIITQTQ